METPKLRRVTTLLAVATALLLGCRFILLDADVPPWVAPHDLGLHLDDGYKSLSPRNLIEQGETHWNPHDDYAGWFSSSPLTQWLYYAAFSIGGVRVSSIRVVGVLFFLALVAAFVLTFRRAYPAWAVALGGLLLTLEPMLYHFSRTALFEVPLAFTTALGLFAVFWARSRSVFIQAFLVVVVAALATWLVKPSGLLYLAPALGSLPVLGLVQRHYTRRRLLALGGLGLAMIVLLLYETRGIWSFRIYVEHPAWFLQRLFNSGLQLLSPLGVAAALLCVMQGLAARPRDYLADGYRLVLISTFLGVPMILALFETPPPRYYPAMVATGPLLVVDHLARGLAPARPGEPPPLWARLALGALSVLFVWYLLRGLDYAVLRRLPMRLGDSPGVLSITMYRYFAPVAAVAFVAGAWQGKRVARPGVFQPALWTLVAGFAVFGLAEQVKTLSRPTYDAEHVRERIREVTGPEASIGGDWAPYLTLGTGRKTLYVNDWFNRAERFPLLRPDYFLSAGSWQDELNLKLLEEGANPSLGEPVRLGVMLGNDIVLYPLLYPDAASGETSSSRP